MWDLIVSVLDHCLSFYFAVRIMVSHFLLTDADWSDFAYAQSDNKFRWANRSMCLFCRAPTQLCSYCLSTEGEILSYVRRLCEVCHV